MLVYPEIKIRDFRGAAEIGKIYVVRGTPSTTELGMYANDEEGEVNFTVDMIDYDHVRGTSSFLGTVSELKTYTAALNYLLGKISRKEPVAIAGRAASADPPYRKILDLLCIDDIVLHKP